MKRQIKKKTLLLSGEVEYFLQKSIRARRMRLSVGLGSIVTVVIPWYFSERKAEMFLQKKASWVLKKMEHFSKVGEVVKISGSRRDYLKNKELARRFVLQKIKEIDKDGKFVFSRIAIKNNKSRWGSCSKKGNLNFNYRIIFLSEKLVRYLIVHELCHLKEFNHSRQFWSLVGEYVSDYKILTKELKKNIF
jgi:predicted metal-dependent hydrolase